MKGKQLEIEEVKKEIRQVLSVREPLPASLISRLLFHGFDTVKQAIGEMGSELKSHVRVDKNGKESVRYSLAPEEINACGK